MLSVIIPVYNNERYLITTLSHIRNAKYRDLEIIIVDDGSSDKSLDIAYKIQKEDSRISVYSKENGGVASARNYGAGKATGEYLCFADQDDIVEPDMYSSMIDRLEQDASDICICSSGKLIKNEKYPFDIQDNALYIGSEIKGNLIYPIIFESFDAPIKYKKVRHDPQIWVCVFRRIFWEKNKICFRNYVNYEDDLLVKIESLSLAKSVSTLPAIGYYWRIHTKSESGSIRYIENIGQKQDKTYQDIINSVKNIEADENVLFMIRQVIFCKQYIDAIHYLMGAKRKNIEFIKNYYNVNIYNRNFNESIRVIKYLNTKRIRWKILFLLISHKMTLLSFISEAMINWVEGRRRKVKW